jgi:hypothetical protein
VHSAEIGERGCGPNGEFGKRDFADSIGTRGPFLGLVC